MTGFCLRLDFMAVKARPSCAGEWGPEFGLWGMQAASAGSCISLIFSVPGNKHFCPEFMLNGGGEGPRPKAGVVESGGTRVRKLEEADSCQLRLLGLGCQTLVCYLLLGPPAEPHSCPLSQRVIGNLVFCPSVYTWSHSRLPWEAVQSPCLAMDTVT